MVFKVSKAAGFFEICPKSFQPKYFANKSLGKKTQGKYKTSSLTSNNSTQRKKAK